MKIKKKTFMLLSFVLGTLLFATTALADIVTGSGYDLLKDAFKLTAENCSDKFNSFEWDFSSVIKDNENILTSRNGVWKFDKDNIATECISSCENVNGEKYSSSSYLDETSIITYSNADQTYYITEFDQKQQMAFFTNPFKENRAEDIEKIVDALVGNLKDYVVITENPDGSKLLSVSLTEAQIPPLINALASFRSKEQFHVYGNNDQTSNLTQDIFVKEVKGTVLLNKDGVMESVSGTAILSGKDKQGQVHNISFEVLGKLIGINTTIVAKPDLTDKKVVKQTANSDFGPGITNPQKFVGKFKNDILIEKDGRYIKIGERCIKITHMDNQTVTGRYYEEYKQGYEEYAVEKINFSFDSSFYKDQPQAVNIEFTNQSGTKIYGNIFFDEYLGKVNLGFDVPQSMHGILFDPFFSPDLE